MKSGGLLCPFFDAPTATVRKFGKMGYVRLGRAVFSATSAGSVA